MTPQQRIKSLRQICAALRGNKTFFLSGHQKPDGDTVASELAMASLLQRLGKTVDIYNYDPVPQNLMFMPGAKKIRQARKLDKCYDVAIVFECYDGNRMGNIIDLKRQAKTVINIDHHLKHSHFGDINYINPAASSNAEQLYYFFEAMKMPLTRAEAANLYLGMIVDTGRFQYSNTNAETLRIASKLLEKDIEAHLICERIYATRPFSALKLLSRSLADLKLSAGGKVASMLIRRGDYKKTGSNEEETEEIVNYGLQPPSVLVSALFRETEGGTVKVSLRSRRHADVCRLAERFGGGGHKYASGCKIKGPIGSVSRRVLAAAAKIV